MSLNALLNVPQSNMATSISRGPSPYKGTPFPSHFQGARVDRTMSMPSQLRTPITWWPKKSDMEWVPCSPSCKRKENTNVSTISWRRCSCRWIWTTITRWLEKNWWGFWIKRPIWRWTPQRLNRYFRSWTTTAVDTSWSTNLSPITLKNKLRSKKGS